jgi:Gram-negative bacterial TonB protein C-terminal
LLAQAATDAVKQWKDKPYTVDGEPVEMETQVSINFHFKTAEHAAPSLGNFRDDTYENEFFGLNYPLFRDWVRETEVMRKRTSEGGRSTGVYVLLAAVHIPQQTAPLEADSSFVLSALESGSRSCEQYFQSLGNDLHSRKVAQQKGTVTPLTMAGRDFYRADFEFRESPSRRTFLCTKSGDYLLQWNIAALSKGAVESTASMLNAIHATPSQTPVAAHPPIGVTQDKPQVARVRVAAGLTQGLILKKVPPIYPQQARMPTSKEQCE